MIEKYYSRGKLLITGEYLVIKGSKSLAIPLNIGQSLEIETNSTGHLKWSTTELNKNVFHAEFDLKDFSIQKNSDPEKAIYISKLLTALRLLSPNFLNDSEGCTIHANIEFNMQWGLGTSSTLINNLAQWCKVNPYELNTLNSKGSGYDIACASENTPITYQIIDSKPEIKIINFDPPFIENLVLVYQNKKMGTEKNITAFLQNSLEIQTKIEQLNELTQRFIECDTLKLFMKLLTEHENIIASVLNQTPVKQLLFPDFEGSIKSLGAWGGDFILAASECNFEKQREYFNNKGYTTVIPLKKIMISK